MNSFGSKHKNDFSIINHYHFLHFQQILSQLSVKSRKACSKINKKNPTNHLWLNDNLQFYSFNLNRTWIPGNLFLIQNLTQASFILRITCGNIWCQINNKKYWVFTYCIINCTGIVVWIYMYIVSWEFSCTLIYLWWKINCTWIIEQFFYFTWYLKQNPNKIWLHIN